MEFGKNKMPSCVVGEEREQPKQFPDCYPRAAILLITSCHPALSFTDKNVSPSEHKNNQHPLTDCNHYTGMHVTALLQCIPRNKSSLSIHEQWSASCFVEYTVRYFQY